MKRVTTYLCAFLLMVGWLCSCSSAPEYGKMIPKDAYFVMTLHVEQAVESFDLGKAETLKKQLDRSLAQAKLPQDTREQLEDIIENPRNTGFDFRQPMMVFASSQFVNKMGVLGAVDDQDRLEDFLTILSKEGACTPVLETEGLRHTTFEKLLLAFNDEWFFMTEQVDGQSDADAVLKEIRRLAEQTEENSLQSNKVFQGLTQRDGFMHLLFLGEGLEDVLQEMNVSGHHLQQTLPDGIGVADFALVCDAAIHEGEIKFVSEALPLTDEAGDWMDKINYYDHLEGTLAHFVPSDVLFYAMSNLDGATIAEQLKKNPKIAKALKRNAEQVEPVMNFISSLDGDAAFVMGKEMTEAGFPEFSIYANVENTEWLKHLGQLSIPGMTKIDDRTFSVEIPDSRYSAYYTQKRNGQVPPSAATIILGAKKNVAYVLAGNKSKTLDQVQNPVSVDDQYDVYMRLSADQLLDFEMVKKQMGPIAYLPFKMIVKLFDYAEVNMVDGRKFTLRLVMKNKEQSPVRTIYEEVEKGLQLLSL